MNTLLIVLTIIGVSSVVIWYLLQAGIIPHVHERPTIKPYERKLLEITYNNNLLTLWYGGADYYEYINKQGIWYRNKSKRKVSTSKQIELDQVIRYYTVGEGEGRNLRPKH